MGVGPQPADDGSTSVEQGGTPRRDGRGSQLLFGVRLEPAREPTFQVIAQIRDGRSDVTQAVY